VVENSFVNDLILLFRANGPQLIAEAEVRLAEHEAADWTVGVLESNASATNSLGERLDAVACPTTRR